MTVAVWIARTLPRTNGALRRLALVPVSTLALLALLTVSAAPIAAQDLERFDPDDAFVEASEQPQGETQAQPKGQARAQGNKGTIDADLIAPANDPSSPPSDRDSGTAATQDEADAKEAFDQEFGAYANPDDAAASLQWVDPASGASVEGDGTSNWAGAASAAGGQQAANDSTYGEDDLIGAAEGVFGKGAEGLAKLIEDLLKKEGKPNAYIVGREAGGAFIIGARYGSGTLYHKVEGEQKVYWTGPSIGFDAGANAANTFVLVYNLYDSEDLFKRYPAGEGQAYFIGGLHASYMRRGDVVLIPIRMGAGVRLGINAGYMKFSKKQRWLPF